MEIRLPRITYKGLVILLVVLFLLFQAVMLVRSQLLDFQPIQILTHSTAPNSPYVCFIGVQGSSRLLAMDCIDITLTDTNKLVGVLESGQ